MDVPRSRDDGVEWAELCGQQVCCEDSVKRRDRGTDGTKGEGPAV